MKGLRLLRDAARAREIAGVLVKYRFDELLRRIDTPASWLTRIAPPVGRRLSLWERVRLAVEELGPTFIKAAQILSTRPDLLPAELIAELKHLRDRVTPLPFDAAVQVLERELGCPWQEVFGSLEQEAIAAGSLGQIHRGTLRGEAGQVAVKIQRPKLKKPLQCDFEIMAWFADQLHRNVAALRPYELPTVVEELREAVSREMDFTNEARNATLFNRLNRYPESVFAPRVFEAYTTRRLLVTEWIEGQRPEEAALSPQQRIELARSTGESFFAQIVGNGFFHGDPHPGNLLVTGDGRLCFLDWGLVGQLTARMRYQLVDLFAACHARDAAKVSRVALALGQPEDRVSEQQLEKAVARVLLKYERELEHMSHIGNLVFELMFVFGQHGIYLTRDYTLLAKAFLSIEETAHALDPAFNLGSIAEPFLREVARERRHPARILGAGAREWSRRLEHWGELPADLRRVLHRLEDDRVVVTLHHAELPRVADTLDASFSRLALAVIIAALLIGSSLVINTGVEPLLWGYPAIGLIGYLLSALMGLAVVIEILWKGLHR